MLVKTLQIARSYPISRYPASNSSRSASASESAPRADMTQAYPMVAEPESTSSPSRLDSSMLSRSGSAAPSGSLATSLAQPTELNTSASTPSVSDDRYVSARSSQVRCSDPPACDQSHRIRQIARAA